MIEYIDFSYFAAPAWVFQERPFTTNILAYTWGYYLYVLLVYMVWQNKLFLSSEFYHAHYKVIESISLVPYWAGFQCEYMPRVFSFVSQIGNVRDEIPLFVYNMYLLGCIWVANIMKQIPPQSVYIA